jgi:hypothetical protein
MARLLQECTITSKGLQVRLVERGWRTQRLEACLDRHHSTGRVGKPPLFNRPSSLFPSSRLATRFENLSWTCFHTVTLTGTRTRGHKRPTTTLKGCIDDVGHIIDTLGARPPVFWLGALAWLWGHVGKLT